MSAMIRPAFGKAEIRAAEMVVEDARRGLFKVHRRAFTDEQVLEIERRVIFDHCWLYLGHASEVELPGSFVTREIAGRQLIFSRDRDGKLHAFYNTCSHRGAMVCREPKGRGRSFYCAYHGWAYSDGGVLIDAPGREGVHHAELNLQEVPKLGDYCGFVFVCFDPAAESLEDYLAGARDLLEIVAEQGAGGMEIIGGSHQHSIDANWKLLAENSIDGYHARTVHSTYLEYLESRDGKSHAPAAIDRITHDWGNGHTAMENPTGALAWGRPCARWVPGWGEEARQEIDALMLELAGRLGEERARRVAHGDRNAVIFPNLVVNDIMAVTVRTFYPVSPHHMVVDAWALGPKGESASSRERRLRNFVEFLGPAGFATPDDMELLELCQKSFGNRGLEWNDLSQGMGSRQPVKIDDQQLRTFWRRWRDLMAADGAAEEK